MSGFDDIPLPLLVRKPIKIKRHCFGSSATFHSEVKEDIKSKDDDPVSVAPYDGDGPSSHGSQATSDGDKPKDCGAQAALDGVRPSDHCILEPSDGNTSKIPWLKSEDAENQSKVVDEFLKEFLVQKMAVIEKERHEKHIPRPEKRDSKHESSNKLACSEANQSEAPKKVQSSQDIGSRPFRDFLFKKMALIEAEREEGTKANLRDSSQPKVDKSNSKSDLMESQAVLEKKKAGIEKECEIAERKAIEMAKETSKPGIAEQTTSSSVHKTSKSHKKDKKKEHKEKKKDRHKSRSRSRDREKDKKSRHKDKHRDTVGKSKHKDRHKSKDKHKEKAKKEKSSKPIESSASQSHDENIDCKIVSDIKLPKSKEGSTGQRETSGVEIVTLESIKVPEKQTKRKISADDKTVVITIKGPSVAASRDKHQTEEVPEAILEQDKNGQTAPVEKNEANGGELAIKVGLNVTENSDKAETALAVQKEETLEGNKKKVNGPIKLGIKISQMSADLIQSGRRLDLEAKTGKLEEGELEDTDGVVGSSDQTSGVTTDPSSSGSVSLSDDDQPASPVKHKRKKSKHKKSKKKHKIKDPTAKRKGSTSRSKTPKKRRHSRSRSRSRSRSYERRRSRSRSPDRLRKSRSRSWERHRVGRTATGGWRERRSRSRERLRDRWGSSWAPAGQTGVAWRNRRSRSRSRERRRPDEQDLRLKIDKAKLREIAIANAYANMQTGQGPPLILKADDIAAIKAGGKSVEELTNFCKKISQKEGDVSSSTESEGHVKGSDDDADGPFIHHPFKVRAPQPNIVMNIRNAKQLPVHTPAEKMAQSSTLRLQFPVSSGSHHRDKEDEWVPVEKPSLAAITAAPAAPPAAAPAVAPPSVAAVQQPAAPEKPGVFPEPPEHPINIGVIVSERLSAMRKLQDNPNDVVAIGTMYKAQQQMNRWAASKQLPGQFTGSTGAQLLSQEQLSGLDRHNQAWIKKDQFTRAAPLKSGIGMYLLQKMGWKQGEGLGKNKEGQKEPLLLDFKTDRKGLTSSGESVRKNPTPPAVKDLAGKHPVSALVELCTKKRWGSPEFVLVHESGPDHKKNFLYKVLINKSEYQASVASTNKKQAKAQAATVCLQDLGLVPRTPAITTTVAGPDA